MDRRRFIASSLAGTAGLLAGLPAYAQPYPERMIKIFQGFAPGGNADAIARLVGSELNKSLGQPVVVESQAGAGGTIAAASVSRAKPDGYTLLLATGGHAVAGALFNVLPYQTVNSFEMVSTITYFPFLIVANASSRLQDFHDLVALARSSPNGIAYGTAGIGSTHHLAGELLAKTANLNLLHVPYKGDAASLTALLAGDIPFIIAPATAVMGNIQAGKLRALAATDSQRWSRLPEIRTVAEQGVPGYEVRSWAGLMAPAGTPRPIIERLNAETLKALQVPAVKTRLMEIGGEARGSTPEEMKAMVASELQRWTQVVARSQNSETISSPGKFMPLVQIRKQSLTIETIYHEGGPPAEVPLRVASACAVVRNPYAGRYEPDLLPFMAELRSLGMRLSEELVNAIAADKIEAYGKAAIVGIDGELEHGALWHEAGGWALRQVLGDPKAIVPAAKVVAATGYRLMMPLHYIHAAYVRSHFNAVEIGIQDAPPPGEILYGLAVATGGRIHARIGGLTKENVSVGDGQR